MIIELNDKKDISKFDRVFDLDISKDLLENPFSRYLGYYLDGKLIGYLNYYVIYNRLEIANFRVLDEYQRRGIGTELLSFLINKYPKVDNITLEVREDNIKAINLYKKMGFKQVAIRNNYYGEVNGLLMERKCD